MAVVPSALSGWSPAQIEEGRRWVETWRRAGIELERIRRKELRALDVQKAIALLCGQPIRPRPLLPTSGLVEQQRWFMRAAQRE